MNNAIGKEGSILFAAEVETPNLAGIAPLVKIGRGLVIFEPPPDRTVYNHLWKQRWRDYIQSKILKIQVNSKARI